MDGRNESGHDDQSGSNFNSSRFNTANVALDSGTPTWRGLALFVSIVAFGEGMPCLADVARADGWRYIAPRIADVGQDGRHGVVI